jgi:hypothetical protein
VHLKHILWYFKPPGPNACSAKYTCFSQDGQVLVPLNFVQFGVDGVLFNIVFEIGFDNSSFEPFKSTLISVSD